MNGSEAMVRALLSGGVNVCFANPGTSEMHFVSALDRTPEMRCVLGLFEGVVTGAADGYYRMAEKPAATLLHLGPGLGNGLANLHNAKRAYSGIVNIVGQHATDHIANNAPLTSDIEGVARPMSNWVKTTASALDAPIDTAAAIAQAKSAQGRIATLILPADCAWGESRLDKQDFTPAYPPLAPDAAAVEAVAAKLRQAGSRGALVLGAGALREKAARLAGRIAARTGCRLFSEPRNGRSERGVGRVNIMNIPYVVDVAVEKLAGVEELVLVGAREPVAFFAYPGKPRKIAPANAHVTTLATPGHDLQAVLQALCDALDANGVEPVGVGAPLSDAALPTGRAAPDTVGRVLAACLPPNAIVVDDSVTSGRSFPAAFQHAAPHDIIEITGGAIGYCLPAAVGAAVACPDRKVLALTGDGSAMYTVQALWTMARENLDITVIVFANHSYRILRGELANMGGPAPGVNAARMLDLDGPNLDWVSMARAHGVSGVRAQTLEELAACLRVALSEPGPRLIELLI